MIMANYYYYYYHHHHHHHHHHISVMELGHLFTRSGLTLLFADDQVIIADREDNLQRAAHKLNQIITEYGLTTSVQKTKLMAFRGRDPVRTKIVIDNKIIEQANSFNYLGNMISYEKELDIDNKLHNYLKITGNLNNVFRP